VTNHDGTELYARLYQNENSVYVIDTRTGSPLRVLTFKTAPKDYWYFDRGDLVGDSLLLRVWNQDQDEMHTPPHVAWLGSGGRVAADREISSAVQAGESRYAVDDTGTTLFKLDSDNRIRAKLRIERPELLRKTAEDQGLGVYGLSASPDGKRLIMFVGIEDGC
jgi:DNA-binding beta-propeller fold protein YncE